MKLGTITDAIVVQLQLTIWISVKLKQNVDWIKNEFGKIYDVSKQHYIHGSNNLYSIIKLLYIFVGCLAHSLKLTFYSYQRVSYMNVDSKEEVEFCSFDDVFLTPFAFGPPSKS